MSKKILLIGLAIIFLLAPSTALAGGVQLTELFQSGMSLDEVSKILTQQNKGLEMDEGKSLDNFSAYYCEKESLWYVFNSSNQLCSVVTGVNSGSRWIDLYDSLDSVHRWLALNGKSLKHSKDLGQYAVYDCEEDEASYYFNSNNQLVAVTEQGRGEKRVSFYDRCLKRDDAFRCDADNKVWRCFFKGESGRQGIITFGYFNNDRDYIHITNLDIKLWNESAESEGVLFPDF